MTRWGDVLILQQQSESCLLRQRSVSTGLSEMPLRSQQSNPWFLLAELLHRTDFYRAAHRGVTERKWVQVVWGEKYKLSQISSPTRRREMSRATNLKESVDRRLMGKSQLGEGEESLTEKCSLQLRHQTWTLWASDLPPRQIMKRMWRETTCKEGRK